jgi:deoxyribodipyrimidine photo-lyase
MESEKKINIFWFRRDLRLHDNAGLYAALKSGPPVVPIFIFDQNILDKLSHKQDPRLQFIHNQLSSIKANLQAIGCDIEVFYGKPDGVFEQIINKYNVAGVYTNDDYEPYAIARDQTVSKLLATKGISFNSFKDQVIFEKNEILTDGGQPYTIFTPFSRRWKARLQLEGLPNYPTENNFHNLLKIKPLPMHSLGQLGFENSNIIIPEANVSPAILKNYEQLRDLPAIDGTSRASVHLRFGTVSIRQLVAKALSDSEKWLNELIWRDFYMYILYHNPHVGQGQAYKPAYERIKWRNNETEFDAWCTGHTGYPIVDAGMRQLNATGFMHNRVRMIVASFLCKHLLIDWRWGEAYFAEKLLDFDLAANNGGWQWAAGSGCDAAPYFRVFSPKLQTEKFDPKLDYIRRWVPDFQEFSYPQPIVIHEFARRRALVVYAEALK